MSKFIIEGGHRLNGEMTVAGNKNAALPIIAATVLTDEDCILENVPNIRDVNAMLAILENLGKTLDRFAPNKIRISGSINKTQLDDELAKSLRASILFMSVLLAKGGEVRMSPPGGCVIGKRNIDSHVEVVEAFGATFEFDEHSYIAKLKKGMQAELFLKEASVTATENALLLGASIEKPSVIQNAASEPHVTDLALVLEKMGAMIEGKDSNRLIIRGQKTLRGFTHSIMPDFIEAGTLAIAAATTQSSLIIHDAIQTHLNITNFYLNEFGVNSSFLDERTLQIKPSKLKSRISKIQVGLWPGFPTDLMSPMIVLATQTQGNILCHDWMYESRMFFVDKLIIMGAEIIQCDPHRVVVNGPTMLKAQNISSPDIRAGIALVIAAMTANGTSTIDNIELVDRGYEDIARRFNAVGAKIQRIS